MNLYIQLIWAYLKIGIFGFGGGYAMLSLIQGEVVGKGWITNTMFTDIVAVSQMTPGPIGINSATYIGFVVCDKLDGGFYDGILGSLLATMAVVIPSYLLVLYANSYITRHKDSVYIKGIFWGLRPVIIGLIASAALLLMNSENFGSDAFNLTISILIFMATFLVVYFKKCHPILAIVLAGIFGFIIF